MTHAELVPHGTYDEERIATQGNFHGKLNDAHHPENLVMCQIKS